VSERRQKETSRVEDFITLKQQLGGKGNGGGNNMKSIQ